TGGTALSGALDDCVTSVGTNVSRAAGVSGRLTGTTNSRLDAHTTSTAIHRGADPWNTRWPSVAAAGAINSSTGRSPYTATSAPRTATFVPNSVDCVAASTVARKPISAPYSTRAPRPNGAVFGSVIMKKRKIKISGDVTRMRQSDASHTGPTCQRAVKQ